MGDAKEDPVTISDDDDADLPSGAECQKASEEFAAITGTDTALAMFYLQDVKWRLEPAVDKFFKDQEVSSGSSSSVVVVAGGVNNEDGIAIIPSVSSASRQSRSTASASSSSGTTGFSNASASEGVKNRIRVLSWNIDGLDQDSLKMRTKGVCDELERENPDVIFLQEVVPASLDLLRARLGGMFEFVVAGDESYFVAAALKKATVELEDHAIESFGQSRMGRNLLMIKCRVLRHSFLLMTSHLESMKTHSGERIRQLKLCFEKMKSLPERAVIFGGDLNLRDSELASAGGIPPGTLDLWESGGRRKEAQFTWDMSRNDNKEMPPGAKYKCRCRFDRLYLRQPEASSADSLKLAYFELAGIQRLRDCGRFPSDHWGILAHLDLVPS